MFWYSLNYAKRQINISHSIDSPFLYSLSFRFDATLPVILYSGIAAFFNATKFWFIDFGQVVLFECLKSLSKFVSMYKF